MHFAEPELTDQSEQRLTRKACERCLMIQNAGIRIKCFHGNNFAIRVHVMFPVVLHLCKVILLVIRPLLFRRNNRRKTKQPTQRLPGDTAHWNSLHTRVYSYFTQNLLVRRYQGQRGCSITVTRNRQEGQTVTGDVSVDTFTTSIKNLEKREATNLILGSTCVRSRGD